MRLPAYSNQPSTHLSSSRVIVMKVVVIADIASNWMGSMKKGKQLIEDCKEAGVDLVKFQMWRVEDLYTEEQMRKLKEKEVYTETPDIKELKKYELNFEKARALKEYADSLGVEWFTSVFYPEAVAFCEEIGVKRYKIASRTAALMDKNSMEVLNAVAKTGKPVIISLGMEGADLSLFRRLFPNRVEYLYCVAKYPPSDGEVFLTRSTKPIYSGFSDHTLGITASIAAVALGARIIEKHVKLPESQGPDAPFSITVSKLKELIGHIRRLEVMLE